MTGSSLAGIVTATSAIALLITAISGLIVSITKFLPLVRAGGRKLAEVEQTVAEVHVIVNQQRTDMERYQRALVTALSEAGIAVPVDQSKAD